MKKIILISIFFISSCGSLPPSTNYETLSLKLTTGMTKEQVIEVLGEPTSKEINGKKEEYKYNSRGLYNVIEHIAPIPLPNQKISRLNAYFDERGLLKNFQVY